MEALPVPPPRLEGTLRLASGRDIGFAEYGAPHGRVVLWFHGTPGGSRQVPPVARRLAAGLGVRLVALERPGIGRSTPHLYPSVLGWADDVGELADRLGVERFGCVGLSGGGPYVLACAARHPDRMTAGAVLGGVAPTRGVDAIGGGLVGALARVAPFVELVRGPLGRVAWAGVQMVVPLRNLAFDAYIGISPEGDRRVFRRPEMREMFVDDIMQAARRQVHAPLLDVVLFMRHWGFELGDLVVPIRLWHGDSDHIVPLAHARHLQARIPGATLRVRPGESHLGSLDAAEEILDAILSLWPVARSAAPVPLADAEPR